VVKDPVTTKYFRFTETQAAILDCLRSPTDIESLAAAVSERLGGAVKPASLEAFLESLDQKMLLDTASTRVQLEKLAEHNPKESQNILYLKVFSLDAEKAFDWLFPKVKWCFTPLFHAFAFLMIATGFVITTLHGKELVR
jgi:hypothetical protein